MKGGRDLGGYMVGFWHKGVCREIGISEDEIYNRFDRFDLRPSIQSAKPDF